VASVLDRSSPNLEHSFPYPQKKRFFEQPQNGRGQGQICNFTPTLFTIAFIVGRHWADFAFVRTLSCIRPRLHVNKHFAKCCKNVLVFYFTCNHPLKTFLQMFCKCFILRVTTFYLQHVFIVLINICKNVLQMFCNIFANVLS